MKREDFYHLLPYIFSNQRCHGGCYEIADSFPDFINDSKIKKKYVYKNLSKKKLQSIDNKRLLIFSHYKIYNLFSIAL